MPPKSEITEEKLSLIKKWAGASNPAVMQFGKTDLDLLMSPQGHPDVRMRALVRMAYSNARRHENISRDLRRYALEKSSTVLDTAALLNVLVDKGLITEADVTSKKEAMLAELQPVTD